MRIFVFFAIFREFSADGPDINGTWIPTYISKCFEKIRIKCIFEKKVICLRNLGIFKIFNNFIKKVFRENLCIDKNFNFDK